MKKVLAVISILCLGLSSLFAQSVQVSGTVTGTDDGSTLPGVTVQVQGTGGGTVTDINGTYSISVPQDATLVFSFVGMATQEIAVGNRQTIDVAMEAGSTAIDEIIVVAYGTAKKSSFTGSATTMKAEALEKRQVANVSQALSGQVAGVQVTSGNGQPGTTSTVRIRGIGSMAAGSNPLYVVDGVPYDGDISSINTADIESTTVLKDAASNALYGARGANGVILVTTKKGTSRKAVVKVDGRWGTNRRGVPMYDVMTDPGEYMTKVYEAVRNGYLTLPYPNTEPARPYTREEAHAAANAALSTTANGGVGYQIYTLPQGESLFGMDGKLNPNAILGYSDGTYYYRPDDWYKELFDKGNVRQEYNMSVSGASDKINYYLSAGYLDDSGIIANSGFTRYTARLRADYQAKEWLKMGTNISYTSYDTQSPDGQTTANSSANLFYIANYIAPIYPLYSRNADQSVRVDSRGFTVYDFGDVTTHGANGPKRTWMSGSNPASVLQLDKRSTTADVLGGRWFAEIDIMDGLTFTYNVGVDISNMRYNRLYNAYYGQYSRTGGNIFSGAYRASGMNQQQLLNYKKKFGIHAIEALAGHETYKYTYKYLYGNKEKLFNPEINEIDNAIINPKIDGYTDRYATEGYLARVQYDYDEKYIVSASYRRDASSRFHKDNRWGNFGSVGAAWVMNRENFLSDVDWVDFLKYKISFGMQGNDDLLYLDGIYTNYYPYMDQYKLSENNQDFASVLSYKGNKDITWETSYSFNTGFDFTLLDERLGGTVEYFSRTTKDMLYYMPTSISAGYSHLPTNVGSMRNSGVEIDLNTTAIKTNDLTWTVYANATFLKNKILKLAPELKGELIDGSRIYREGESMYQFYMRSYAGVNDSGQALYYVDEKDDKGNVITEKATTTAEYNQASYYKMGDILPKVYGGFGTTLSAYGFDASVSCAYQLGGRIADEGYRALMFSGTAASAGQNWHKDIRKSWTPENKTDIPQVNAQAAGRYANAISDRFLTSSDYMDITNITVGYTLPKRLTEKVQVTGIRVYFVADNVALFSKRKGLDPRQSYTAPGGYRYAPIRTLSGGVSVTF